MPLNDIVFNKGRGGLSRPLEGTDYVSGLLFYTDATLPSGFTSADRIKIVYSVQDAEDLGITDENLGETAAVANIAIGGTPAAGDTIEITYTGIQGIEDVLETYTLTSADATTTTTAATAIAAQINAGTVTHGFSATAATSNVILTTKDGEGIFPNTGTPYAASVTGGVTATITQPDGTGSTVEGIASDIDIQHYHISEFFRLQPKGKLYVGLYATADFGTFASVTLMQNYAQGTINQLGVYSKSASFATSQCNGLQSVCTALEAVHKPIWAAILAAELSTTTNLSTLTDNLHALSDPQVSVCIGQDGANTGYHLWKATGKSITNLGEMLGAVALAKVSESIAWFGKFQVATEELDTVAFCNGQNFTDLSDSLITNLDTLGYCFLRKVPDLSGTFHNRPYTAVSLANDYCFIHANRTIFKAIKNVRATVLPAVGSPVKANSDGTLSIDAINYFKGLAEQGMDVLERAGELSAYAVLIADDQDVVSTGLLEMTVQIIPLGTADFIEVNIGFTNLLTTT